MKKTKAQSRRAESISSVTFYSSSRALCEFEGKVAEDTDDAEVSRARFALISKISLQFIAFFTTPFISEISRAPAKISHQYADEPGKKKRAEGTIRLVRCEEKKKKGCTEKRTMNTDR